MLRGIERVSGRQHAGLVWQLSPGLAHARGVCPAHCVSDCRLVRSGSREHGKLLVQRQLLACKIELACDTSTTLSQGQQRIGRGCT